MWFGDLGGGASIAKSVTAVLVILLDAACLATCCSWRPCKKMTQVKSARHRRSGGGMLSSSLPSIGDGLGGPGGLGGINSPLRSSAGSIVDLELSGVGDHDVDPRGEYEAPVFFRK